MEPLKSFVDIHCHIVPGIDDGSKSWSESLAMARMALTDGISTVIATPHQLGTFAHNRGVQIRQRVAELQHYLTENGVDLRLLPGADVRIEPEMIALLHSGEVLTLGDHRRHVLLELPHELYFPLEPVLDKLESAGLVGVLSHPERNQGILKQRQVLFGLVERGCLMQLTAGSVTGAFGTTCQELAEWMLAEDLAHVIASDAHGQNSRRPLLGRAFQRISELTDFDRAQDLCCTNPAAVAGGKHVALTNRRRKRTRIAHWFPWRRAA